MQLPAMKLNFVGACSALVSLWLIAPASGLGEESAQASRAAASGSDPAKATNEQNPPEKQEKRRLISITNSETALDVRQWPLIGSPDAKYVFVEMFDYTCPHCQATHRAIRGAMERYGKDLAIITLPTPMDTNCNSSAPEQNRFHTDGCEVSRIAVAVWRVQPKQFTQFHSWLLQQTRTASEARRYAHQLVGQKALQDELARGVAAKYIAKNIELYQRAGGGSVPKLLFPKSTLTGEVSSTDTLCQIIERELGGR